MNEGRGTPTPFELFGAPWMDARAMARHLNNQRLPGATFKATTYVPRSIPNVALNPLFKGRRVNGVRIIVDDVDRYQPLEVGIHALAKIFQQAKRRSGKSLFKDPAMFTLISGTRKLRRMLEAGQSGASIIAAWRNDVRRFRAQRAPYLLY